MTLAFIPMESQGQYGIGDMRMQSHFNASSRKDQPLWVFAASLYPTQLNPQVFFSLSVKVFNFFINIYFINLLYTCFMPTILPVTKDRKISNLNEDYLIYCSQGTV